MGFWSGVGTVAKFIFNTMEEMNRDAVEKRAKAEEQRAKIDFTKSRFENKDTRELVDTLKSKGLFSANEIEKRAAFEVLKERGVVPERKNTNAEQNQDN